MFTRADSIDLTLTLRRCYSWQAVASLYDRHRELPLHPINVAAFFSQLRKALETYRDAGRAAWGQRGDSGPSSPRHAPLLDTLPGPEREAVDRLCSCLAFSAGRCLEVMGGREIATIARWEGVE